VKHSDESVGRQEDKNGEKTGRAKKAQAEQGLEQRNVQKFIRRSDETVTPHAPLDDFP
jgi:hypothetical protein